MLTLLDMGLVMVHLDPRSGRVRVPSHLRNHHTLRLNIAYGFQLPVLQVMEDGIDVTLSFGGVDHGCWLPWESVFALTRPDVGHHGMLWPGDVPSEMTDALVMAGIPLTEVPIVMAPGEGNETADCIMSDSPASRFVVHEGGGEVAGEADAASGAGSTPPALRIVKG